MKNLKHLPSMLSIVFVLAACNALVLGQASEDKLANVNNLGSSVRFDVSAPHASVTLTVIGPEGVAFTKEFKSGNAPEFKLNTGKGERLPDGLYTWELRVAPNISDETKRALKEAREKDNAAEVQRELRKRGALPSTSLVQSGSFLIAGGSVILPGAVEERSAQARPATAPSFIPAASTTRNFKILRNHPRFLFDQVIADDLIVQGSICAGLDCVNNEDFGFDTIRVKENNTRIQFDDTSTSAGFPNENWQIRANDSGSGGTNFLGIVDQGTTGNSETGTIVFAVNSGASANSIRVGSNSKVGLRTATPVLDIHANTSDTPAMRLEQNNTGGFTAQTWDVAGNEANFCVRGVTSGSRLPFRIRPGAPSSSIDIAADGKVGVGTASPTRAKLEINQSSLFNGAGGIEINAVGTDTGLAMGADATNNLGWIQSLEPGVGFTTRPLSLQPNGGRVGIGTNAPDQLLSVNGEASKVGGGSWATFSDERLKNIKGQFNSGLKAVMQLQPIRFEYKPNNPLGINSRGEHVGFGAQSVQQVIPEAVSRAESGYLQINNDPILWTMLNAIKEQQKEIEQLRTEVRRLRVTHRRNHRRAR